MTFIVIDGTDGSGKATQTQLLVKRLKEEGKEVEVADFPQYGQKSAVLVEEYLNGKFGSAEQVGPYRASIFYVCDRFAASGKINKWLKEGKVVVSNRYTSSNMGHQAGKIKDKEERDKFLEWLEELEFKIFAIPKPDFNLLLYMPPQIGQELVDKKGHRDYIGGQKRDIHEADINHLKDAAEAYMYVAQKYSWKIVDCAPNNDLRSKDDISDEVWEIVSSVL